MKENFNVKGKNGSITIFVLVGLLFMSSFLIVSFAYNVNKSKVAKEQFNIISDIYSHKDSDAEAYNRAYTALRKKNKQILTKSIENSSTLELEKTYEDNLVDYRIYGTEEGVGDTVNLFNINSLTEFYSSSTSSDATSTISDGVITNYMGYYKFEVLANSNVTKLEAGTYTISANVNADKISGNKQIYVRIWDINNNKYGINSIELSSYQTWERISATFTITEDIEVKGIQIQGRGQEGDSTNLNIKFKEIQLEKSPVVTEYMEYGQYKTDITTRGNGKNLYYVGQIYDYYDNTKYFTIQKDKIIGLNKAGVQGYITNNEYYLCNIGESYTFSFESQSEENRIYVVLYDENKNNISKTISVSGLTYNQGFGGGALYKKGNSLTININSDNIKYLRFGFATYDSSLDYDEPITLSNIQLEKLNSRTAYEPYKGKKYSIILDNQLKNGDYIDFKQGKVVRANGIEENIELPKLLTYEDYTKIEVLTAIAPSKIEVEYLGYTFE